MKNPVDEIDLGLLRIAAPSNKKDLVLWVEPLQAACRRWGIDTVREVASFLAQGAVESMDFTRLEESLYYSAERLAVVWPYRYAENPRARVKVPNALAKRLARNPQALANNVYANRMGNGPETSGDGFRHRGLGIFQLTGKENQSRFAHDQKVPLTSLPVYLKTREGAAMSAGWYWHDRDMDKVAATPGVRDDRIVLNGGTIGLNEVEPRFNDIVDELLRRGC